MSNSIRIPFIIFLALTLCGEGMLTVTMLWTVLDQGGTVMSMGLVMALMSIVPFLMQKYSKTVRNLMTNRPIQVFGAARIVGIVVIGVLFALISELQIVHLYVMAGLFSIILFLSTQSLESYMSHLVLEGKLSSAHASNMMQTGIQIGAFGGNAIAGFLLASGGFMTVLIGISVSLAIGMFFPLVTRMLGKKFDQAPNVAAAAKAKAVSVMTDAYRNRVLASTVIGVVVLTMQLASFNFLGPITFHDVFQWDAMEYGIVSSAAGVGALMATLIGRWDRYVPKQLFLLIFVLDLIIGSVNVWAFVVFTGFCLGFVFNHTRITQRVIMFDHVRTKEETTLWTSRTTLAFQFMKAVVPLVLVFPLGLVGEERSGQMFALVGLTVTVCMFFVHRQQVKRPVLEEQADVTA